MPKTPIAKVGNIVFHEANNIAIHVPLLFCDEI